LSAKFEKTAKGSLTLESATDTVRALWKAQFGQEKTCNDNQVRAFLKKVWLFQPNPVLTIEKDLFAIVKDRMSEDLKKFLIVATVTPTQGSSVADDDYDDEESLPPTKKVKISGAASLPGTSR
jgi:hypothetical protein